MITAEQWKTIEETLKYGLFKQVKFKLPRDGHIVTVHKTFIAENKTAIVVWIDGERSDGWGWPDSDNFRPLVKEVWKRKTFRPGDRIIRRLSKTKEGKRLLKQKENASLYEVREYWLYMFDTASQLVKQYRTIPGLELITEPEPTNV